MAAITEDECRRLKLMHILETAGQSVLTYTLHCGTPGKPSTVTLLEYLDNLPQQSTANYTRERNPSRCFNATDLHQISGDPTCTTFDVLLLHKTIKLACENMAGINEMVNNVNVWTSPTPLPGQELEHYCTKIKNARNEVVYEVQPLTEAAFLNKVTMICGLLDKCLSATKDRYARDNAEYLAKRAMVQAKVTDIQQETLGMDEILRRVVTSMLPNFKLETDQELKARLDSVRYLTPLHFLDGIPEDRVEMSDIFCDITLAEEREMTHRGDAHKVPYLEVLRLCDGATASTSAGAGPSGQARPQVLVVEGEAAIGKTHWVSFLVQQWLTPQDRRRVHGLDRYELLLWVVCRERRSTTLEGLVQQLLPESHLRYRRLLLPLLKKCRVLVVIDGIDEVSDVSRPLVANILSEAAATTFTVVCTSRPHSVQNLKAEALRMDFQVSHVRMLGITRDTQRTELVLKHYQWLRSTANTAADTDALRQAVRGIIWREMFKLPLNLLFLATVFFYEPHRVSTSLSQSELYEDILTWCREKLQASLEAAPPAKRARRSSQAAVDRVLDMIHEVALRGLLQNHVSLTVQNLPDVENTCITENLDPNAFLSAFFTMRREETAGEERETYMFPHKSLQEFMAAKFIAQRVRHYSEGAIERVLRGYTAGQNPPLDQLQQTLVHLLSLLVQQGDAMKEVMDLLYQSGVTGINKWVDLLTVTMAPDTVVQHAVKHLVTFGLHSEEEIWVRDESVQMASVMLQHLPQWKVGVQMERELADMDKLALVLAHHRVTKVCLQHHWRYPQQHAASATLLRRLSRGSCYLERLKGHLDAEDLASLKECLRSLSLVVRDSQHAQTLLPALAETSCSLMDLQEIILHIPAATVTPAAVTRLPAGPVLEFYLSGVTDDLVEAAGNIVVSLCPPQQGFAELAFPEATLDLSRWKDLISRLEWARVRVRSGVYVPDTHITEEEGLDLHTFTTTRLGCDRVDRIPSEDMWMWS